MELGKIGVLKVLFSIAHNPTPDAAADFRFVFVWWGKDFCHEIMNLIYWKELVKVQKLLNVLLKIQIHFINIQHYICNRNLLNTY